MSDKTEYKTFDNGASIPMSHATISPRDHMEIMQYMNYIKAAIEENKGQSFSIVSVFL